MVYIIEFLDNTYLRFSSKYDLFDFMFKNSFSIKSVLNSYYKEVEFFVFDEHDRYVGNFYSMYDPK